MSRTRCLEVWGAWLFVVLFAQLVGCSSGKMAEVTGKVTYKGKPLAGAHVSFWPDNGAGRAATGITDADGQFTLGTLTTNDGAPPGTYRVSVMARGPDRPPKPGEIGSGMPGEKFPGDPLIPVKFFAPESSGLTFEVKRGKNTADFQLTD